MRLWKAFGLSLLCILSLSGCFAASESSPAVASQTVEIGTCSPFPCIRASIGEVPALPEGASPELRAAVEGEVRKALYAPIDSDEPQTTKDLLMSELQARYDEMTQPGVSDVLVDFEITREAAILYQNPDVVTVDVRSEGFLGGAHGFNERTLMVFDVKNGKRITLKELVSPTSQGVFEKLVEAQFRRAREVPASQSLADAGYFVKPGASIPLPENFGITPGGIVIQYNPYEIAPYAYGPTEIVVPLEAFQGVVSDSSRGILASLTATAPKA